VLHSMAVLLWLHLVGAALWLGGLVALAMAVLVAPRTLPCAMFRVFVGMPAGPSPASAEGSLGGC